MIKMNATAIRTGDINTVMVKGVTPDKDITILSYIRKVLEHERSFNYISDHVNREHSTYHPHGIDRALWRAVLTEYA